MKNMEYGNIKDDNLDVEKVEWSWQQNGTN
jgi:hypothetical protein